MIASVGAEAAARLAAIHAETFARPWSASEIATLLANPVAFALTTERGFVLAWAVGDEAEILTLAVAPDSRRAGLGAGLVAAAAAEALGRGARSMRLEVAADNAPARALYAKLGFAEAGARRGYYAENGADALVLVRKLPL